jgi:hypothetical protein
LEDLLIATSVGARHNVGSGVAAAVVPRLDVGRFGVTTAVLWGVFGRFGVATAVNPALDVSNARVAAAVPWCVFSRSSNITTYIDIGGQSRRGRPSRKDLGRSATRRAAGHDSVKRRSREVKVKTRRLIEGVSEFTFSLRRYL